MRDRIWTEIKQAKKNHFYCIFLVAHKRRWLHIFNIMMLIFSGAGVMGWKFWESLPIVACAIIAIIQLLRLIQTHIVPSEKEIEKLNYIIDFYFKYYNKLEKLWMDSEFERINELEAQEKFYELKNSEKAINKSINEVVKWVNHSISKKSETETIKYIKSIFNYG